MSFAEHTAALAQSFRRTRQLLEQLLHGLQARRTAWVAARPSTLSPSPELEQLTQEIAREEAQREPLLARIRATLPAPVGAPAASLHVNVTRIAAALPGPEAKALREVADAVQSLAKAVRAEVTLGQRLIRFARQSAPAPLAAPARTAPGYDRTAHLVRSARTAGALVDGKV